MDAAEVRMLENTQGWLRGQLGKLGVTIESNPSSNLVIGDFGDLRGHPTFALSTPEGLRSTDGRDQLDVSINSDDPLTFASCLADEYAYMEAALVGRGVSARAASSWLDAARRSGWRSRFSLLASAEPSCLNQLRRHERRTR